MTDIQYHLADDGIVTLTLDCVGQATNTMTESFRRSFSQTIALLESDKSKISGVILTSAKSTFFAGGDLNALLKTEPDQTDALFARAMSMKSLLRRIELLGRPVVAAINGSALGGGFEICLACHARFALDDKKIRLGLPEVSLGLMPGAGGIVRLTRFLGLQKAIPLILDSLLLTPQKAADMALVNAVVGTKQELLEAARKWILANPSYQQPWDSGTYLMPGASIISAAPLPWLRSMPVQIAKKYRGLLPAPELAFSAAVEGAIVNFDAACRIESRYFAKLAVQPVTKSLISTFFFQMNDVRKGIGRPEGYEKHSFSRIGVIGAGLMGSGIAHVAAQLGMDVVLKDADHTSAQKGKERIAIALRKSLERGRIAHEQVEAVLSRIEPTADATRLDGCDFVIEAVYEDRQIKATVTKEAELVVGPEIVIASNTSTLPITGLAHASSNPQNYIGLHFFSPVDRMPLVEIVKGKRTSDATLAKAYDLVLQLGKTPILVNDSRGFFTTRVFGTYTREGMAMLAEGVDPALIENAAMSLGFPVGPLAIMDEVSLRLSWEMRTQTVADLQAEGESVPDHPAWAVVDKMVNKLARPGRAGGGGFYDYPVDKPKMLWPGLVDAFGQDRSAIPWEDIRDRLLYVQPLEAARCMQEGVITNARDANIGSTLGIGFPRWTGGVLQYINMVGLHKFVNRANTLAAKYGDRFGPPKILNDMIERQATFD